MADEVRSAATVSDYADDLLYDIVQGLGCVEPGFGDRDYDEAMKAQRALREYVLRLEDALQQIAAVPSSSRGTRIAREALRQRAEA